MTAASLTSPMPMPRGIGQRRQEEEPAGRGAGDQVLGQRVEIGQRQDHRRRRSPREQDAGWG